MDDDTGLTIVRDAPNGESRQYTFSERGYRRIVWVGGLWALAFLVLAACLGYFALRADRLADRVAELETDVARVDELARTLVEVERAYEAIRALYAGPEGPTSGPFLPPAFRPAGSAGTATEAPSGLPDSWPLTQRGFLTQPLLEQGGTGEEHPGIDIAVPAGSYIRAAGPGVVIEAGEDPIYGQFLVLDHGDGYRTLYGHASLLTVERGATVRRNQVVGLTGSTGRSTAPHLHFEILLDGEPIDPLEIVQRP